MTHHTDDDDYDPHAQQRAGLMILRFSIIRIRCEIDPTFNQVFDDHHADLGQRLDTFADTRVTAAGKANADHLDQLATEIIQSAHELLTETPSPVHQHLLSIAAAAGLIWDERQLGAYAGTLVVPAAAFGFTVQRMANEIRTAIDLHDRTTRGEAR